MSGNVIRDTDRAEVSTTAEFNDKDRVMVHFNEWVDGLPVTKSMDPDEAEALAEELLDAAERFDE